MFYVLAAISFFHQFCFFSALSCYQSLSIACIFLLFLNKRFIITNAKDNTSLLFSRITTFTCNVFLCYKRLIFLQNSLKRSRTPLANKQMSRTLHQINYFSNVSLSMPNLLDFGMYKIVRQDILCSLLHTILLSLFTISTVVISLFWLFSYFYILRLLFTQALSE